MRHGSLPRQIVSGALLVLASHMRAAPLAGQAQQASARDSAALAADRALLERERALEIQAAGMSDLSATATLYREALAIAERRNDRQRQLYHWGQLANTWRFEKLADSVAMANDRRLALARALGDSIALADVYLWIARDAQSRKASEPALAAARAGLAALGGLDTARLEPEVLGRYLDRAARLDSMAAVELAATGAADSAAQHAARHASLRSRADAFDRAREGYYRASREIAVLRDSLGSLERVRTYLEEQLAAARQWRFDTYLLLSRLGETADSLHDPALARRYERELAETEARLGKFGLAGTAMFRVGTSFRNAKQYDSAAVAFREAYRYEARTKDHIAQMRELERVGMMWRDAGHPDSLGVYVTAAAVVGLRAADTAAAVSDLRITCGRAGEYIAALTCPLLYRIHVARGSVKGQQDVAGELVAVMLFLNRPDSAVAYGRTAVRLAAQLHDAAAELSALRLLGRAFAEARERDSATVSLRRALALARSAGDRREEMATLRTLGVNFFRTYRTRSELDSSAAYDQQVLVIARELHDTASIVAAYQGLGHTYKAAERADSALHYFTLALELARRANLEPDRFLLGNAAYVFQVRGLPDSALYYDRLALALDQRKGYRHGVIEDYIGDADLLETVGLLDSALVNQQRALALATEEHDDEYRLIATQRLANLYEALGRTDSATIFRSAAAALRQPERSLDDKEAALSDAARVQLRAGHLDSALALDRQLLELVRLREQQGEEAGLLARIGDVHRLQDRLDSAEASYRASRRLFAAIGDRTQDDGILSLLADVMRRRHRSDSAIVYLGRALAHARAIGDVRSAQARLEEMADLYLDEPSIRSPERAVAYYDSAAMLDDRVSATVRGDLNRVSIEERSVDLYGSWARAWLALPSSTEHALAALAAVERGRSRALLDLLRDRRGAAASAGRPARSLPEEGKELAMWAVAGRRTVVSYFVTADTLVAWWLHADGHVEVRRTALDTIPIGTLVRALRSRLGVDSADGRAVPALDDSSSAAPATRGVDDDSLPAGSADALLLRLAHLLLPPDALRGLAPRRELLIVPYGIIALVPFPALPVDDRATPLAERVPVRFAPSLEAARSIGPASSAPRGRAGAASALVVADPAMPFVDLPTRRVRLPQLTGAAAEGAWIARRLGTTVLGDTAATKAAVRSRIATAGIVHFATHGYAFASDARARDSFIALAPTRDDNGLLTVGEIVDDPHLALSADLVVLSACQTGLGNRRRAEGTVGLQRAFLAKGARNVLVSLWSVNDDATRALMERFYTHWLDDRDPPAEALRRAQEDIRTDSAHPRWREPRYWAAFQLVGAG